MVLSDMLPNNTPPNDVLLYASRAHGLGRFFAGIVVGAVFKVTGCRPVAPGLVATAAPRVECRRHSGPYGRYPVR